MKKLLIFFQILSLNFLLFSQGLNDVCSPSQLYVYAAGSLGQVLKSSNSGNSYSRVITGSENLNSVYSVGATVWCAGDNGFFSVSHDFGVNWINSIISVQKLNSVYFVDSLNGYIAGNNGIILKTTNGGSNWNPLASGVNFDLNKIKFSDQLTGFCSGYSNMILKTTNGGLNWITLTVSASERIKSFDVKDNLLIAGGYSDIVFRSTDNGISWSENKLNIITHPAVNAVNILTSQNYNILLESGSIWNTTNSGSNYTYSINDFHDELNAMCSYGTRSYAVSKNQDIIERSLSSGLIWQLPASVTYTISFVQLFGSTSQTYNKTLDINYQRRGVLYTIHKDSLFISSNMGVNWDLFSRLPSGNITLPSQLMINMKDSNKILAGKNNGSYLQLYRTSDHGANWALVFNSSIDAIGNFMNQDPQHPDTVYIGAKDSVFRSTNFGLNWIKIATGDFQDWCDIAVKYDNSQILYSSTNHYPAKLNKSTNGGLNWFFIDFIADTNYTEMPVLALSNLSPNVVLHAQLGNSASSVGLKRSYTAGNSWLFNQLPGSSWSVDIAKDDPNLYAYGSVSYDPIFISTNSGGSFAGTSNFYAEQLLYYDRANLFINNHGTISKMKVTYNMPFIGLQPISSEIPKQFSLAQNFPNPFNPVTVINFDIVKSSFVKLIVYDITGKELTMLAEENLKPGKYHAMWNATGYPSGVYFYRLTAGDYVQSKKMILIK